MKTAVENDLSSPIDIVITWFFDPVKNKGGFIHKAGTAQSDMIVKHNGSPRMIRLYNNQTGVSIELSYSDYKALASAIAQIVSTTEYMFSD